MQAYGSLIESVKGRQGKAGKVLGDLQLRRCNSSKIPNAAGKFPVFLISEGIILTLQRTKTPLVRPHLAMQHKLLVQADVLVPESHCFWLKPLLPASSLKISMACQMLLCIYVPLIRSISLIVGIFHLSVVKINIHILIQKIADLLWEDELSGMGTVITYSYHSTVSRIHPIIIPN